MKKLKLNKEYMRRHRAVALLMCALCVWFTYDGLVAYPRMTARELYVSIEQSEPPAGCDLEAFKIQKTRTQYIFAALAALAALVIGGRLWKSARLDIAYDEQGFIWNNRAYTYKDIVRVDDKAWKKKGISVVTVGGRRLKLDSWHHEGVREMHARFMV